MPQWRGLKVHTTPGQDGSTYSSDEESPENDGENHSDNCSKDDCVDETKLQDLSHYLHDKVLALFVHGICLLDEIEVALAMPLVDILDLATVYTQSFWYAESQL